jgi:PIN domain nuclease of toxin-antitoxin system
MTYVLDACALFTLLNGEEGEEIVDRLFQQAHEGADDA